MKQSDVLSLPDGMHRASECLYLYVRGTSRSWVLKLQKNGKRRTMGLGSAKVTSLSSAKEKAAKALAAILEGATFEESVGRDTSVLFKDVALKAIRNKCNIAKYKQQVVRKNKTPKSEMRFYSLLRTYTAPLNDLDVNEITQEHILSVLKPIWETKTPTAKRLRGMLELIFDYAYNTHLMNGENPARWKHRLENFLPSPSRVHKVEHRDSVTLEELRAAVTYGMVANSIGWKAVVFGALTATRTVEFCLAKWSEIDFKKKIWLVDPSHRKGTHNSAFRVPLSTQTIELLNGLPHDSEFVFPGSVEGHISTETPRMLLIKLFKHTTTMHGCRGTFKSWCIENKVQRDVSETCLSHRIALNEVEAAYIKTDLLDLRRPIMQKWADAICQP